jgi:hypothetical protein
MANVPDHNDPTIHESSIRVFKQKYYVVDDEGDTRLRTDYKLREERIEIVADDDGVFIESTDGGCSEALSIATPEMAKRVARYILEAYGEPEVPAGASESGEHLLLTPETRKNVGHELWRLENHCRSSHGPVYASGAPELLNHLEAIAKYLDIKPAPHQNK